MKNQISVHSRHVKMVENARWLRVANTNAFVHLASKDKTATKMLKNVKVIHVGTVALASKASAHTSEFF